jgi:CRISPR system Cascade subunit CasC
MSKNFINFHVLISPSPSCLTRDDMNMQKTAVFGGTRRVRISSQSLKRTLRKSAYYKQHFGEPSVRTLRLSDLRARFVEALASRYDADLIKRVLELLSGREVDIPDEKVDTSNEEGNEKSKKLAVMPWAVEEVAWYCEQIRQMEAAGNQTDGKELAKEVKKNSAGLHQAIGNALDIALSGRMATSGLMSELGKVDGALSVAHAITTHTVESDLDWFTAVDDLRELGSGHLDTQEFSSGVFYRYASLNIAQLQENLGGVQRQRVLEIAAGVLHMLATEVPGAKRGSTAAFNLADLALVSVSDLPVSLANAFEAPVRSKDQGFITPSIAKLHDYWRRIHRGYGIDERCAEFVLNPGDNSAIDTLRRLDSLPALEAWLARDGQE